MQKYSKITVSSYDQAHKKLVNELYRAVRTGINLESFIPNFKALFLVGGPGSGKDFLIHSTLDECHLKEVSLDKLYSAINEKSNIDELTNFPSIIVNGNADSKEKIIIAKEILESMGYDTAMIYVHTTDEESKSRNDLRISRGSKTFSEGVRKRKYDESVMNMHEYSELFESFVLYDNSNNFSTVDEEKQKEITGWLLELSETISGFLSKFPTNEESIKWMAERVLEVGTNSTAKFAKELTPGQGSNNVKSYNEADQKVRKASSRDGDKYTGGGVKSGNFNSPTRTCAEEKEGRKEKDRTEGSKKVLKKVVGGSGSTPSAYSSSQSYAIGSAGVASEPIGLMTMGDEPPRKKKRGMKKYPESRGMSDMYPTALGTVPSSFGLMAYKTESVSSNKIKETIAKKMREV